MGRTVTNGGVMIRNEARRELQALAVSYKTISRRAQSISLLRIANMYNPILYSVLLTSPKLEHDEIKQVFLILIHEALIHYDSTKNAKFSTYVYLWLRGLRKKHRVTQMHIYRYSDKYISIDSLDLPDLDRS